MTTTAETHTPSRACYLRGCRLDVCITEADRYRKQLRLEHHRGQYRRCDATQTRHHIERLTATGWSQRQIAAASGVLAASIHKIHVGAQADIATWRAAAILSVEITAPPANPRRKDATGSRRRLQALRILGHTRYNVATRLGITPDRIKHITNCTTNTVTVAEAAAIARLYRQLCTIPGPSQQTATIARKAGWHGPLAWDDIDDPDCLPETEHRTSRGTAGSRPKVYADPSRVAELTAANWTAEQIANEIGCHKRSVVRARRRSEQMAVAA